MADVFLACPRGANPQQAACYAIKRIKARWHTEPCAIETFKREALVGSTVANPHVVPVLGGNVNSAPYYLVMPHLVGVSLKDQLRYGELPSLPAALWIARQAAEGLAALAAEGWTHGDVKPANLFLSPQGHTTLLDFGFARRNDEPRSVAGRPIVGTLNYMAPELLTSDSAADIRSDIYSLGIVLYEMLTGQLPYEGRNPAEIAELQRAGVPDRLRCLVPMLPLEVVDLVRRMLCKHPLRRPQTPDELTQALVRLEMDTLGHRLSA